MPELIDRHCHVLPGIDDGPATIESAVALVRDAREDGIGTIAATPHVDWWQPELNSRRIHAAVKELQARLDAAAVAVRIVPGAELAGTRALDLDDAELRRLTLGGAGWLLLESPISSALAPGFAAIARSLVARGHRVLLGHPERSALFLRSPKLLDELVAEGMLVQVTAGSLTGRFGRTVRNCALALVERGSAHVVASDGHNASRPPRIARELGATGIDPALASWLAQDVPSALLAGERPPPRPAVATRRHVRLSRAIGHLPKFTSRSPVRRRVA
jgi:protein-tyrosine phosphatase